MKETKSTTAAGIRELVTAVKDQMSDLGYGLPPYRHAALSGICTGLSWVKRMRHRTSTGPSTYCWTSSSSA